MPTPARTLIPLFTLSLASISHAQPLPTDPRLVTGELDNGLRYIVLKHAIPPGRASVWMNISSGSLNETDPQRGIAHFLEHMAFNGSKNFPPGSLVPFFESLGLTFGQHQNAFTSFDQTAYLLELPDNKVETLDKALTFMSDVCTGLSLLPEEIENERQVILEEKRSRLGPQQRVFETILKRIAPGSTFGERIPIGVEETITGVKEADFREYYTTWYTPSNTTVMIVADVEEKTVVERVRAKMGGGARVPRPVDRAIGVVEADRPSAIVASDEGLSRASVMVWRVRPMRPPVRTEEQLKERFVEQMASIAFGRRLDESIARGELAADTATAYVSDVFGAMTAAQAVVSGRPDKWREMVRELGEEIGRARKYGYTDDEAAEVRKLLLAQLEQSAETEPTRPAQAILATINDAVAAGESLTSSSQDLEIAVRIVPTITAADMSASFASSFDPSGFVWVLTIPSGADVPTEAALLEAGNEAMGAEVKASERAARADRLMDRVPEGGTIKEMREDAATGVWSGLLGNNARVDYRFMDYAKNEVLVSISLIGGKVHENGKNRGVTDAAMIAWGARQATRKLSSTDIESLMLDKKISVSGGAGLDTLRLSITGNPDQLEAGLQLAHLLLTEPKIEPAAFDQWKTRQLQYIESMEKNPDQYFGKLLYQTVFPKDDARVQALTREQVERITLSEAQAWLDACISESPIEVAIVGDIEREKALGLLAKYIGSLSMREHVTPSLNAEKRKLPRPDGERTADATIESPTPMAIVFAGFFGPDERNVHDCRRMNIASRVLSTRLFEALREKEKLVYSIDMQVSPGSTFPGYGLAFAAAPAKPESARTLASRLHEMFGEFKEKGITPEELATAKKQVANTLDEDMKKPGWWLGVLDLIAYTGVPLSEPANAPAAYEAVTAEEVKQVFSKYYDKNTSITVVLRPVAPGGTKDDRQERP